MSGQTRSSEAQPDEADLRAFVGKTVGSYRLEQFLDEGAFGGVFSSTQMVFGEPLRKVAIKISKRTMEESEAREMFSDALMMTKVLDRAAEYGVKQRFVDVYDAGRFPDAVPGLAGHPYVVMEFVSGGNLSRRIRREGPFPLKRAANYLEQLLEAVAFMHSEHGIAHRDLKPENVLFVRKQNEDDYLKVSDFGLAVETQKMIKWVPSGGTLAYLAPESFSLGYSSLQSDVYALGLIFHEMIVGENPFAAVASHAKNEAAIQLSARQREPFTKLKASPEMRRNQGLLDVILTALKPDTGSRFENAGDMLNAWKSTGLENRSEKVQITAGDRPNNSCAQLCDLAEQAIQIGDEASFQRLLSQARELIERKDGRKKPPAKYFYLSVKKALRDSDQASAGKIANQGIKQEESFFTCLAMAEYYGAIGSSLEFKFRNKAEKYPRK